MPSTPYAQFEEHVGPHGLKIARILTGTKQEPGVLTTHPLDAQKLYSQETELSQAIARLSRSWRWWAESYGYFNRKSDAQVFEEEVSFMLTHRYFSPSLSQWQLTGVRNTYNDRGPKQEIFFIDPDTEQVISTQDSYNQPAILTDEGETIGFVNVDKLTTDEISLQVIRLATIILDVSLYMAGSNNASVIEQIITARSISLQLVGLNNISLDRIAAIHQQATTVSAEIASITDGKVAGEINGDEYVNYLIETFKLRNEISVQVDDSEAAYALLGLEKPKPIAVESAADTSERKVTKKARIQKSTITHANIGMDRNAHFHRFEIDGVECFLVAELDIDGDIIDVIVYHPEYSPRESKLLQIAAQLILANGGSEVEYGQAVLDYLSDWIQNH